MAFNETHRRPRCKVLVRLECGHSVRAANNPFPNQKFICALGQGCGYKGLLWVSFTDDKGRTYNRRTKGDNAANAD